MNVIELFIMEDDFVRFSIQLPRDIAELLNQEAKVEDRNRNQQIVSILKNHFRAFKIFKSADVGSADIKSRISNQSEPSFENIDHR